MTVKEVIAIYGEDKEYIAKDGYEGVYYSRQSNGSWVNYSDGWTDELDDEEALEVDTEALAEYGEIWLVVDTSL
jgi:hypothetical protein